MTHTDFIILGSGIAGLRAAIVLGTEGRVTVVSKGQLLEGSSIYAQGGIAVALDDEDIHLHRDDTLKAGCGLSRTEAVDVLAQEGPHSIEELIRWGAQFDTENGGWAFAKEAAHSRTRVMRAGGDATGHEVVRTLFREANRCTNITWKDGLFAVDLIVEDGLCRGITVLDESTCTITSMRARAVILATGGAGQVYARTTNPIGATGDGVAMAYRAGAKVEDLEFVQFHPTTLCHPASPQFLISEAMRGEGAILRRTNGEPFMSQYHPAGDLASRDIVTQAMWTEQTKTGAGYALLDITHRDPQYVRNRFPTIYETCMKYGIDITTDAIPVFPSAHYMMGGVWTDVMGSTTIPGLYAAGEVACSGVHGANRLASNSLLEGLVFGKRAAESARSFSPDTVHTQTSPHVSHMPENNQQYDPDEIRAALRTLMWEKVGIARNGTALGEALQQLEEWSQVVTRHSTHRENIELVNLITIGQCITRSALLREESIGAHYRTDFPPAAKDTPTSHSTNLALAESG